MILGVYMYREIMIESCGARDIVPIFSGYELCEKGHSFGPYTRNYYLIHFCLSGKGKLFDKFGEHEIKKGELFIIRPGEITTYTADESDPWEYAWISFGGEVAKIFDTDSSVYPYPIEAGIAIRELWQEGVSSPYAFISFIYKLIHQLFGEKKESYTIAEKMKRYIKFNYMEDISVEKISDYFGFERSYLYRTFKNAYGIGIKEYIVKTRMEQAKNLLKKGYSVGSTAHAVGYRDQFNFSKAYKKHFGVAPKKEG